MTSTMPLRRRRRRQPLDTTPCTVDVTPGHVVFHDGAQRAGRLHDVPTHLAMHWQKHGWASIVTEPAGAGVASHTDGQAELAVQGVAMTALTGASHDLRDADTDPTDDADADRSDCDHPMGPRSLLGLGRQPFSSATFHLYGSHKIGLPEPVAAQGDTAETVVNWPPSAVDERTGSVRVRHCGNCGEPVSGRRKWCSEACRLQAYRGRQDGP